MCVSESVRVRRLVFQNIKRKQKKNEEEMNQRRYRYLRFTIHATDERIVE